MFSVTMETLALMAGSRCDPRNQGRKVNDSERMADDATFVNWLTRTAYSWEKPRFWGPPMLGAWILTILSAASLVLTASLSTLYIWELRKPVSALWKRRSMESVPPEALPVRTRAANQYPIGVPGVDPSAIAAALDIDLGVDRHGPKTGLRV